MSVFFKVIAGSIVTVLLYLYLNKQEKNCAYLLILATCCMVLAIAVEYLSAIFLFFDELQDLAQFDSDMLKILLKAVGIGLLSEIAAVFCADSGNAALGKAIQFFASSVILWMSIPVFTNLIDLIKNILISA